MFFYFIIAEKALPVVVQRALKWKLTTITPIIVKKVVQNSGFKFTRREYTISVDYVKEKIF